MANISSLKINGTTYNIKDSSGTYVPISDLGKTTFKVTRGASQDTAISGYWSAMVNTAQGGSPTLPTTSKWWHVLSMDWSGTDTNNWVSQLAVATQDGNGVWWRKNDSGGTGINSSTWHRLAEGDADGKVAWSNLTGIPSSFTPSSHNHDSVYVKKAGDTMSGRLTASGHITLPTNGGSWISQATTTNASIEISTKVPINGNRYDTFIAGTFDDDSHWAFGGIEKCLDFTYFAKGRTENSTDGRIKFDIVNSNIVAKINGFTIEKSVPSNAVFTDTNTWRPLGTGADQAAPGNHNHDTIYLKLSGGTMDGLLKFNSNSLPDNGTSTNFYFTGINSFADGGRLSWCSIANAKTVLGLGDAAYRGIYNRSSVGGLDWSTYQNNLVTNSCLAYWNGTYNGTSSNLQYCDRGRFGTIVTKATGDYAAATHNHTVSQVTDITGGVYYGSGTPAANDYIQIIP